MTAGLDANSTTVLPNATWCEAMRDGEACRSPHATVAVLDRETMAFVPICGVCLVRAWRAHHALARLAAARQRRRRWMLGLAAVLVIAAGGVVGRYAGW